MPEGMSVGDKLVAAQKITDIMLKVYSPVASNEKFAKYGDSYGIKNMDSEDIQKLTDYQGNVDELINTVKGELGAGKEKVAFNANEFNDGAVDKVGKIDEKKPDAPVLNNNK